MVLKMSTFSVLPTLDAIIQPSEFGIMTINCSEVEEKEGYLQIRLFNSGTGLITADAKASSTYKVPIRSKEPVLSITDSLFELCALYKQDESVNRKLDVIFLYALDEKTGEYTHPIPAVHDEECYFARPGLTLSVTLKPFNQSKTK